MGSPSEKDVAMGAVRCFFLFTFVYFGKRSLGMDRTLQLLKKWGRFQRRWLPVAAPSVEALQSSIKRGYSLVPLRILCLDNAMVHWYLLNRHGYDAVLKIGVTLFPMMSHAWVELGDKVFIDMDFLSDFQVMAEYGPWTAPEKEETIPELLLSQEAAS